jgi:hypothetical protein
VDSVAAKRQLARQLGRLQPYARFEPLAAGIDERGSRNRDVKVSFGDTSQRVKPFLWQGINNTQGQQFMPPLPFVDGGKWRLHAISVRCAPGRECIALGQWYPTLDDFACWRQWHLVDYN